MIYVHVDLSDQHCNYASAIFFMWSFSTLFLFCISTTRAFLDDVAHPFQTSSSNDQRIINKFSNKDDFILKKNL